MKKYVQMFENNGDYFILILLNSIEMVMELVASRLMSPYFGNTNFVWTAIIGIILLAGGMGNLLGGRLASSRIARYGVSLFLLIAAVLVLLIPLIDDWLLGLIGEFELGVQVSSVLGSVALFLLPSTLMGFFTPVVMKERIGDGKEKGKESGRITALIAVGSLVGTFVGGFWLIPALGTEMIFVLLGFLLIIIALLIRPWRQVRTVRRKHALIIGFVCAIAMGVISFVMVNTESTKRVISIDTEYGRIIIEDEKVADEDVRLYKQSGAYSSATFLDDRKKYDLVFDYLKKYDEMFKFLDVKEVAMIGGAAYQYPKYFISHYEDKKMDVIEIDKESTRIAKEYFFLNDLINDYGEERLGLYNEDGRVFLANSEKKYDVILNDAFAGKVPVGTLATAEAARIIKDHLNDGGVYMSNVLGTTEGDKSAFLKAETKTLGTVFDKVYILPVEKENGLGVMLNWMVIATDNDVYQPDDTIKLDLSDAIVLTDDYCPVEQMVKPD